MDYLDISECNDHKCNALAIAKDEGSLSAIKYICKKLNINYKEHLYDGEAFERALGKAILFKDLEGCKHILRQYNKTHPHDLYNAYKQQHKLKLAIGLADLEGIKYISTGVGLDYKYYFSSDAKIFTRNESAIYDAIKFGDLEIIKHIQNNQLFDFISPEYYSNLIRFAYNKNQLNIAAHLINHRSNGDPRFQNDLTLIVIQGLIANGDNGNYQQYKTHIDQLAQANIKLPINALEELTDALFLSQSTNCTHRTNASFIYSNYPMICDDLPILNGDNKLHWMVQEVVRFINIINLDYNYVRAIIPKHGIGGFFTPSKISHLRHYTKDEAYYDHFIYAPVSNNRKYSELIHEISHALLFILLKNNGEPYYSNNSFDMVTEYNDAVNATLKSIISIATKGKYSDYTEELRSILLVNYVHLSPAVSEIEIEWIFARFLKNNDYSHEKKKLALEMLYQSNTKIFGWSQPTIIIMDRILDYFERSDNKKSLEFLVRIPELYSTVEETHMEAFKPAVDYWKKHISPLVQRLTDEHYTYCSEHISKYLSLGSCLLNVLSHYQIKALFRVASQKLCYECINDLLSKDEHEIITTQTKDLAISDIASLVSSCVKKCLVDEHDSVKKCSYINPVAGVYNYIKWFWGDVLYNCIEINKDEHPIAYKLIVFIMDSQNIEVMGSIVANESDVDVEL